MTFEAPNVSRMRFSITKCPVPDNTMLDRYSVQGSYVDCYWTEIPGRVSFSEYVFAFYTTSLFRLERLILQFAVNKPSTDTQARQLAEGIIENFAAWRIENRSEKEVLLCDFRGRTRSWLMITPLINVSDQRTRLYFGSAVVPARNPKTGKLSLGFGYELLLGFHRIYSVTLLYSAKSRLMRKFSRAP